MPRYQVSTQLTYVVDLPDEEAVYSHADDIWVDDVEAPRVTITYICEEPE